MKTLRFRSSPTSGGITDPAQQINADTGVIRGVSALQAVEALGHNMTADAVTVQQCADAINAASGGGIKSRFTHPGACTDALGKMLGRVSNASVIGDKVVCDLQLSKSAKVSPDGDLWTYVITRAQEDPASFGMSIAFAGKSTWLLDDGSEVDAEMDDDSMRERPANAVGDLPRARISKLIAVDVVDEPAANRDGLFSANPSLSDEAFHTIDAYAARNGFDQERLSQFACRYFAARGLNVSVTTAVKPAKNPKGIAMKPEELKALKAKHPDHAGLIVDMFADSKSEVEMLAAIKDVQLAAALSATQSLSAKVDKLAADHAASLSAKDDQIAKLSADLAKANKVAELGSGAPLTVGSLESDTPDSPTSDDAALEKRWSTDAKLRSQFFNDKAAFVALAKLEDEHFLATSGRGVTSIKPIDPTKIKPEEG